MKAPLNAQTFDDIIMPEIVMTEKAAKMSVLHHMLAILNGEIPVAPISRTLNYKLNEKNFELIILVV